MDERERERDVVCFHVFEVQRGINVTDRRWIWIFSFSLTDVKSYILGAFTAFIGTGQVISLVCLFFVHILER